jgi:hypothetical protein
MHPQQPLGAGPRLLDCQWRCGNCPKRLALGKGSELPPPPPPRPVSLVLALLLSTSLYSQTLSDSASHMQFHFAAFFVDMNH